MSPGKFKLSELDPHSDNDEIELKQNAKLKISFVTGEGLTLGWSDKTLPITNADGWAKIAVHLGHPVLENNEPLSVYSDHTGHSHGSIHTL